MNLAIDFDGTCVIERFPLVGEDVPHAVEVLKELSKFHNLILWTVRGHYITEDLKKYSDDLLLDAVNWFVNNSIPLYGVNKNPGQFKNDSPKIHYDYLIDDKAIGTPLMEYNGKTCVDWIKIRQILKDKNLL